MMKKNDKYQDLFSGYPSWKYRLLRLACILLLLLVVFLSILLFYQPFREPVVEYTIRSPKTPVAVLKTAARAGSLTAMERLLPVLENNAQLLHDYRVRLAGAGHLDSLLHAEDADLPEIYQKIDFFQSADSMLVSAVMTMLGKGCEPDFPSALEKLQGSADKGNVHAAKFLTSFYEMSGDEEGLEAARHWRGCVKRLLSEESEQKLTPSGRFFRDSALWFSLFLKYVIVRRRMQFQKTEQNIAQFLSPEFQTLMESPWADSFINFYESGVNGSNASAIGSNDK